jgi:hypothetical protein
MRLHVLGRIAGVSVALLIASCLAAAPVQAADCKHGWPDEECTKAKVKTSAKKPAATVARKAKPQQVARQRPQQRVRSAQTILYRKPAAKWHGRVDTRDGVAFYHDGQRYAGGSPRGPAMWYNNYEGGFNAALYWKLSDRQGP